jgi:hypothetical protein
MRKTNIIIGIIFFIAPWLLYKEKMKELSVEEKGRIVKMRIIEIPISWFGGTTRQFMDVEYEGVIYSKRIGRNYCVEHKVGDLVDIKYLENIDFVLLPTQSVWGDIYAGIGMSLFGLVCIIYYGFIIKPNK